jgi:hypothetical protein
VHVPDVLHDYVELLGQVHAEVLHVYHHLLLEDPIVLLIVPLVLPLPRQLALRQEYQHVHHRLDVVELVGAFTAQLGVQAGVDDGAHYELAFYLLVVSHLEGVIETLGSQPEVNQIDHIGCVCIAYQDVRWFEVTICHAYLVQSSYPLQL